MENRKEEHIIEDLLFEISAREVLAKAEQGSASVIRPIRKYLAYAAVFLALIATLVILNRGGSSMDDRLQVANNTYTYPQLGLSRSAERSIVDDYLTAFNAKEVEAVIQALEGQELKDKDRYALAHAYYYKGSLQEAKAVILEKKWEDDVYKSDMDFLLFLIAFVQDEKEELKKYKSGLSATYAKKAEEILKH